MKHKVLAIVVSLVLIMSMVLPGTLAVSVDGDGASSTLTVNPVEQNETTEAGVPTAGSAPTPTGTTDTPKEEAPEVKTVTEEKKCNCTPVDGVHANTCPLYEAPKAEEKTGDTQPPVEPEKKCTCGTADGTHTADCALYVKPQDTNSEETKSEETKSEETKSEETKSEESAPTEEKQCNCTPVDGVHADTCPLYGASEETKPQCTCGTTDDTHAKDCPLYVEPEAALFDRLMAAATAEAFEAIVDQATEEELGSFTCEEFDKLDAHYIYLTTGEYPDYSPVVIEVMEIVDFTNVAPLVGSGK